MTALNERKLAEMDGRLVAVDDLVPAWTRVATAVKLAVLAIPGRARARLPHLTPHDGEALDDLCRAALLDALGAVKPSGPGEGAPAHD
jgi:phage terminase Nu1 subunit (DNA packaging protein)